MKELREYLFFGYSGSCDVAVAFLSAEFECDCYALAYVLNFVSEYDSLDIECVTVWSVADCADVCTVVL